MARLLTVNPDSPEPDLIALAAAEIRRGRLVAFPTETVYGLGANALDALAVERIFLAKGRPPTNPLIVHLASAESLSQVVAEVPPMARFLAQAFWPGPLTLILPRQEVVPPRVSAGLPTVAVRVPAHPVALALMRASATPIAAPSANRFSSVSPTTAQHVLQDLGEALELILDGGPTPVGLESTVLDITCSPPKILRPGGVTREAIEAVIGPVAVHTVDVDGLASLSESMPSPGMLVRHYTPRAELWLVSSPDLPAALDEIARLTGLQLAAGRKVGLLLADEDPVQLPALPVSMVTLGPGDDLAVVARNLYAGLRRLDEQGVDLILSRDFGEQGLGLAIRDRLRRAASQLVDL